MDRMDYMSNGYFKMSFLKTPTDNTLKKKESALDVAIQKVKKIIDVLRDTDDIPNSTVIQLLEGAIKGTISEEKIEKETNKFKNPAERRLENI